jgi:uncharacterized membrane protein YvbJ
MAMTSCPECKKQVSDQANTCPHCGHPILAGTDNETPLTIQKTKKRWKLVKAVAAILLVIGILLAFTTAWYMGVAIIFLGLVLALVGGIGAWWSTG